MFKNREIMISYFISAMRTLTAIPVRGKDCEPFENSLYAFPLDGAVLGAILTLTGFFLIEILNENSAVILPVSAVLVLFQVLLTRGFHLDGIADAADGFGGGFTKERALEIMKDSHVGAFGGIAIALDLLLKFALFSVLLTLGKFGAIIAIMVFSRTAQVFQCVVLDYARENGTAATTVQKSKKRHIFVAILLSVALTIPLGFQTLFLLPLAIFVAFIWGLYCKKRSAELRAICSERQMKSLKSH